ncbi:E3 ubiquitin-protein ligase RNF213-like, partial [Mya arenaria]|uniref:E3 ubiquitin-protein ligase RNF213-like n=1 Tax=Mya arenaria TaxID=6604 RepID=UPI0022E5A5AF
MDGNENDERVIGTDGKESETDEEFFDALDEIFEKNDSSKQISATHETEIDSGKKTFESPDKPKIDGNENDERVIDNDDKESETDEEFVDALDEFFEKHETTVEEPLKIKRDDKKERVDSKKFTSATPETDIDSGETTYVSQDETEHHTNYAIKESTTTTTEGPPVGRKRKDLVFEKDLIDQFCKDDSDLKDEIKECLTTVVCEATIEKRPNDSDAAQLFHRTEFVNKISTMFATKWEVMVNGVSPENRWFSILKMTLQWTPILLFLEHKGAVKQISNVHKQNTAEKFLDELCDVNSKNIETNVTAFGEIHSVEPMLSELMKVKQSRIFELLWNQQNTENIATLQDIHERIWKPAFKRFEDIKRKLKSGDLELTELEVIIIHFRDKNEIIQSEFEILGLQNEVIQNRLKQLQQYRHVQKCVEGAQLLLQIQHAFNLTGDFSPFEDIVEIMHLKQFYYFDPFLHLSEKAATEKISVSDVLSLKIFHQGSENTEAKRHQQTVYTYSDLKDLQSRLSLVVGQNDQSTTGVHNFLQILNSLVRLTNVYLQLCNAGCSLYNNWTATFHCDSNSERTVCSTLEFGGGQEKIHLEQLAILQTELVQLASREGPEGYVYPLLSAVKPNCNLDHVNEALNASKDDVSIKYASQDIDGIGLQGSSEEDKIKIERRKQLINEITQSDYSIEIATRFVKAYPDSKADIREVLDWCAENSFMADEDEDDTSLSLSSTMKKLLQDAGIESGNGSGPLKRNLKLLWRCFQESIKLQISDFFSIEHIGLFLQHLKKGEWYSVNVDLFWRRALFEKNAKIYCIVNVGDLLYDVSEGAAGLLDEYISQTGEGEEVNESVVFDEQLFNSAVFQRPFQYLKYLDEEIRLSEIKPAVPKGTPRECLTTLLRYCGIKEPLWSELHHFVQFLNTQLEMFERNAFVSCAAESDLPGFRSFVLRFLLQMSRDFSNRTLNIVDESSGCDSNMKKTDDIPNEYTIRNKWESSPHPYLFFNSDESTFTFLGFNIENCRHLVDLQTGQILEENIINTLLYHALIRNQVNLQENFDKLGRLEKIMKLCNVMGIKTAHDPDPTYELTTDNVKKILAIHMRFRCDIPVIVMGETGCGKTRLIQFMCEMQRTPESDVKNMLIMKVHGGTTGQDIKKSVAKATNMAKENIKHGSHIFTVLFFDEANTTECVGLFKELLCDKTLQGEPVDFSNNLKIVAACNPYRKHTDDVVKNLESAGLGYHVRSNETSDRFGNVPMRRLVYRVQPLPRSLLPLVWDFGQLSTEVEELYIKQMVMTKVQSGNLPNKTDLSKSLARLLAKSQEFMREQKGECSFVSLRDVERVLNAIVWFHNNKFSRELFMSMDEILGVPSINDADSDNDRYKTYYSHDLSISQTLIDDIKCESDYETDEEMESLIPRFPYRRNSADSENDAISITTIDSAQSVNEQCLEDSDHERKQKREIEIQPNRIMRSIILALGLCYHASLKNRIEYRRMIAHYLKTHFNLAYAQDQILKEIESCQQVFLDNVSLDNNIAKNSALRENVFMMAICIELRIPLFLVGKPGSSKSLAKTIVSDAMKGKHSERELFKKLKQTQTVSFQCSPLATSDGIVRTFRQCSQFQQENNLDTFVATVILDEVGLAEDSPKMPLKVLHPLLENGCLGDENPEKYMKVAFIGISNWALDPAKMNRGILVQREIPDLQEIALSAEGICEDDEGSVKVILQPFFEPLAKAYEKIFVRAITDSREFFGLRDFFCMIKMLYNFVDDTRRNPTMSEVLHCIKRNFGGLKSVNSERTFQKYLQNLTFDATEEHATDCSDSGLIDASIFDTFRSSRYPLLMTESFGTLTILQQKIEKSGHDIQPVVIFGSSFRGDQEYTQICRNINQIKVCMETGKMVVLLNMENLYESLYDALNQYYMYYGENRYVDLGLGYHRVKCQVHPKFRLIVVAETETVYRSFPIPLINRLEKHFLSSDTLLTERQKTCAQRLRNWAFHFASETETLPVTAQRKKGEETQKRSLSSCFVGYRDDACSAIMVNICRGENHDDEECQQRGIQVLIQIATPESVIRQEKHFPEIRKWYFDKQHHHNVFAYMKHRLSLNNNSFDQITTHSKLFSGTKQADNISRLLDVKEEEVLFINSLYSLETEQQFADKIRLHLQLQHLDTKLIVVQCDSGDMNQSLIDCARFCITREFQMLGQEHLQAKLHVFFIVQLPRTNGGCFSGFQCGAWSSVHIDDIHYSREMPAVHQMIGKSVMDIFMEPLDQKASENINRCDVLTSKQVELDDIKGIIVQSVTTAMSMVKEMDKDDTSSLERSTTRIDILLKHISSIDIRTIEAGSLLGGLHMHLARLLAEKETIMPEQNRTRWFEKHAVSTAMINKYGTLRRSCQHVLESEVALILAGVIAYIDTNGNLDILETDQPWKYQMWIRLLNTSEILDIEYERFLKPSANFHSTTKESPDMLVLSKGYEGHTFKSKVPFSWILKISLDNLIQIDPSHSKEDISKNRLCLLFLETPFGKLLEEMENNTLFSQETVKEIRKEYIDDFVHMNYNAKTEHEFQFVKAMLIHRLDEIFTSSETQTLVQTLVSVHLVFEKVVPE